SNHFEISQNLLKVIAKRNPVLAIKISENINTETRRERARMLILDSYLDNNLKNVNIDLIKKIEDKLIYSYTKQELSIRVMERFSEAKSLPSNIITELLFYFDKIKQITDNDERAYGLVLIYKVINKNTKWKEKLCSSIEKQIENALDSIEADWEKIDNGYRVCSEIAKINPEFAKNIFSKTEVIKNESWLDSRLVAYTFMNSLKVIIRSYGGLINVKGDTDDDFKQLADMIQRIPSEIEKLNLWTELGFQCFSAERDDIGKKVLNNHIIPIFQELMARNVDVERVVNSLTLIHILNPSLYNEFVTKISIEYREDISKNLAFYYLTKRNPYEEYDTSIIKYSSNYSDIKNVITALKDINTDGLLYYIILNLFKAIDENRSSLGKIAISTITDDIDNIIDTKLPDLNNIKHEGYKYLLKMRVAKIKKNIPNKLFWNQLIIDSQSVTNLSDQVFLKSDFLANLPFDKMSNGMKIKKDLFQEVIDLLNSFKVHFEYIQRVIDISDTM
ncbi:MAG: hypothetical protein KJZ55_10645, partial [Flavobacteriales bacterium]|nr:hypothetical protein [Flavobacteriales bacterium]